MRIRWPATPSRGSAAPCLPAVPRPPRAEREARSAAAVSELLARSAEVFFPFGDFGLAETPVTGGARRARDPPLEALRRLDRDAERAAGVGELAISRDEERVLP